MVSKVVFRGILRGCISEAQCLVLVCLASTGPTRVAARCPTTMRSEGGVMDRPTIAKPDKDVK